MEFKINLSQIITATAQIVALLLIAWRVARRVTIMENDITNVKENVSNITARVDKVFDKIDAKFDKWEERFFGRATRR